MNDIEVRGLDFRYPDGPPVLRGLDLSVPHGARCLLVGANGSGKSTLLRLIAGRHLEADAAVRVCGRRAFSDASLAGAISFIGGAFPLDIDITVDEMLARRSDVEPARRARLLGALAIERGWHMNRASDGQRRRVQLLLGLLRPCRVLLLDEVTTDLDLIARGDLLAFLRDEGVTILYATHILEGLDDWATHVAYLHAGCIAVMAPLAELGEYQARCRAGAHTPLLRLVDGWLRRDRAAAGVG